MKSPLVSVGITTYNHCDYIGEAIESVLNQEVDFDIEILLGDDCSTDGTTEICRKYAELHPDKIKLYVHDRSNVIYIDEVPTGRYNLVYNMNAAKGEYVALLDGDDYWSDPQKLKKQVAFLKNHPNCAFCFHDIFMVSENGENLNIEKLPNEMKRQLTHEELVSRIFPTPPTGSILYRRKLMKFPDWFFKIRGGDIGIGIILSKEGHAGYIDEKMSSYRQHQGGVWSTKTRVYKAINTIKTSKLLIDNFSPIGLESNSNHVVDNYLLILKLYLMEFKLHEFYIKMGELITFLKSSKFGKKRFFKRLLNLKY